MKIVSSHMTSIHLSELTTLPDEFRLIPATEYHHLILLHLQYRKEVKKLTDLAVQQLVPCQPKRQSGWGVSDFV